MTKKFLIIRFSSIGDIVLTTPIIRCIKSQTDAEVHFLTKKEYKDILSLNPYLDKIFTTENNSKELIKKLNNEGYDYIIDLHNNIRSFWFRLKIKAPNYIVKKEILKRLLLIYFGVDLLKNHIVDRYFKTLNNLGIKNDNKGLDYFIESDISVDFNTNQKFIAWCIAAKYPQKQVSEEQILKTCSDLSLPIVLLGGKTESEMGLRISAKSKQNNIYNFCGSLSLNQSAYLIEKSAITLTNDTGLMHIAAAFKKPIISFWGCTKPALGFSPYLSNEKSVLMIANPNARPCSKHGSSCRFQSNGCVKQIDYEVIKKTIEELI